MQIENRKVSEMQSIIEVKALTPKATAYAVSRHLSGKRKIILLSERPKTLSAELYSELEQALDGEDTHITMPVITDLASATRKSLLHCPDVIVIDTEHDLEPSALQAATEAAETNHLIVLASNKGADK